MSAKKHHEMHTVYTIFSTHIIDENILSLYADLSSDELLARVITNMTTPLKRKVGQENIADVLQRYRKFIIRLIRDSTNQTHQSRVFLEKKNDVLAMDNIPWIDTFREAHYINHVHGDNDMVAAIIPRLTVELYDHQRVCVRAMLDLESKGEVSMELNKSRFQTNAGSLRSHLGSGKTIMILALSLLSKCPPNRGEWYALNNDSMFIRYARKFLMTTLIVVNKTVYEQYRQEIIQRVTDAKVLCVHDAKSFSQLSTLVADKNGLTSAGEQYINGMDFVLVRNAPVAASACVPWETKGDKPRNLVSVIADLFAQYTFARAIYDDYDTGNNMRSDTYSPRALFHWYVSATSTHCPFYQHGKKTTLIENLDIRSLCRPRGSNQQTLIQAMAVMPTQEFVEQSKILPCPVFYVTRYINYEQNALDAFNIVVGDDEKLKCIQEMLNGDAIDEAADRLGIVASSVKDVFSRILKDSYEPYIAAVRKLKIIKNIEKIIEPMELGLKLVDRYQQHEIEYIEEKIRDGDDTVLQYINKRTTRLETYLSDAKKAATKQLEKNGGAIHRLRQSQTECQICRAVLYDHQSETDEDVLGVVALSCCGVMFCHECAIVGTKFRTIDGAAAGNCPKCHTRITPEHMIFVSLRTNIGQQLSLEDPDDAVLTEEKVGVDANANTNTEQRKHPKFFGLLDIINGKIPKGGVKENMTPPHMLRGSNNVADVDRDPTETKVLVFANHRDTLTKLRDMLVAHDIKFVELKGNSSQKMNIINSMKDSNSIRVMMLLTETDCHGLNLQFMTDQVFMHKIINPTTEAQAMSRAQRIGRDPTMPLRIHFLLYRGEKT